jgi:hypothetical protein
MEAPVPARFFANHELESRPVIVDHTNFYVHSPPGKTTSRL